MPTTANNETLERIKKGELAIEYDGGTVSDLNKALSMCFSCEKYAIGAARYYKAISDECWSGERVTDLPAIKVSDLLAMIKENVYEVYYNGEWHIETEENYKELVNNANCYGRINGINQGDIIDAIHSDTEETQSARDFINSQEPPIHITSKELNKSEPWDKVMTDRVSDILKPEPVSSDTQEELWRELIDIYDVTDRDSEGYGSLIKVLSESFTIQRNPLKP